MREDVIKQISALNNINHIVVLSHNIDFIFLQTVFLSALKRCGHPGLTVFADEQCARESYRYQSTLITGLGKRFRVVPVSMNPGYRFHPKAIFLAGDEQAVLFVGSGNMTFGGLRDNAEIWNRFDTKSGDFGVISAFQNYLTEMTDRVPFKETVQTDLMELFDAQNYEWVKQLTEPSGLLGRVGESNSLISQMQSVLQDHPIIKITVSVPYYDPEAKALRSIAEQYPDAKVEVLIQSGQSTLLSEAAEKLPSSIKLKSIGFTDPANRDESLRRFIHAKYFAFTSDGQVDVFAGSANCSIAALVKGGREGNAELMVHGRISREDFVNQFLDEFVIVDEPPKLLSQEDIEQDDQYMPTIKLLGARFDISKLRVSFESLADSEITACFINDEEHEFAVSGPNELLVRTIKIPRTVYLKGQVSDQLISSNTIWVDHESSLRSSSKGRALLEKIRSSDSSQDMQAEEWMMVVELFAKDLEYTTAKEFHKSTSKKEDGEEDKKTVITRSDVFSSSYDKAPDFSGRLMESFSDENLNIYQLLLHAFGISTEHHSASDQTANEDSNDEDMVDQPENLNTAVKVKTKKVEINDRVRRRITKVVNAIVESFTDQTYLELRDPEGLNRDLQIAGLVLRKGLSEGWVENDHFFDATQKIWSKLFFSTKSGEPLGWLGIRYQLEENQEHFRETMATPQLSAVLFAWAIAVDVSKRDAFSQRFLLSMLLSMGRFPWLWHDGLDQEEIYSHLKKILKESPCRTDGDTTIDSLNERRINLLRQGVSLAVADHALSEQNVVELRDRLNDKEAEKGDILWQGKRGLCISLESTATSGNNIRVLCLQDPEGEASFQKDYLMPIDKIIEAGLVPENEEFGPTQIKELTVVLDQLSSIQL